MLIFLKGVFEVRENDEIPPSTNSNNHSDCHRKSVLFQI